MRPGQGTRRAGGGPSGTIRPGPRGSPRTLSSFRNTPSVEGLSTREERIRIGAGCALDCPFCNYRRGRVGQPLAEVLDPVFPVPVALRVTMFAGDLVRADLAPLVKRVREAGATSVLAYAHSGARAGDDLRALADAGLTGLHFVLPAASKDLLAAMTGGRGSLARAASLMEAANALDLDVVLEVPLVEANAAAVADTVRRAGNRIARLDQVVVRFLAASGPAGPARWDPAIARDALAEAADLAQARGAPLHLAPPTAPPPCLLDLPRARPEQYPGFAPLGWKEAPPDAFPACAACDVAPVCRPDLSHLAPAGREPQPVRRPPPDEPLPPAQDAEGRPVPPTSAGLFLRQESLGRLLEALRHRPYAVCRSPWEELEAHDIRGTVAPCAGGWPLFETLERCTSWRDTSLLQAWNSEGMRAVRRAAAEGRPFDTCKRECPAFHGGPQTAYPAIPAPVTRRMFDNVVHNLREMLEGAEVLSSRPQVISFSPTLRCPNRCRMCDIHEMLDWMGNGPELQEMPDALFDELVDLLPTTRMLALTGGEPLVSRRVRDVLRRFTRDRYPDGGVTITTNALLLRPALIRELRPANLRLVYVSLNAATDETYERLTGTKGGFGRVLANVKALRDALPSMASRPTIRLSFVVQRSNHHELPAFLDLARGLGLGVRLQPVERDRLGESIFTDVATLDSVIRMVVDQVRPRLAGMPRSFAHEVDRLESMLRGKRDREDFTPL